MPRLRLLHISLTLSAIVITLTLGALRSFGPVATVALPPLVAWTLLGFAGISFLSGASVRTMIPGMEGVDEAPWIAANTGRAVAVWAVLEGGVCLCAVALFLGANVYAAGILAAGGLGYLASLSPGTLAGH